MNEMSTLIVTAVEAEREAVIRGLNRHKLFDVIVGGVGPITVAARTAIALTKKEYGLVISLGIGGGFKDQVDVGSIAIASEIIMADLGAETAEGFISLDELGFGTTRAQIDQSLMDDIFSALQRKGFPVFTGPILTVSTVTGTMLTADQLATRVPGAVAEAMEGYGVAVAAQEHGLPVLEIRTISNQVGPRDRSSWRIKEALEALEATSSVLMEVLY